MTRTVNTAIYICYQSNGLWVWCSICHCESMRQTINCIQLGVIEPARKSEFPIMQQHCPLCKKIKVMQTENCWWLEYRNVIYIQKNYFNGT